MTSNLVDSLIGIEGILFWNYADSLRNNRKLFHKCHLGFVVEIYHDKVTSPAFQKSTRFFYMTNYFTSMFKLYTLRLDSSVYWLVVSTPLKNISQWEGLSHIDIYIYYGKNPNHQSDFERVLAVVCLRFNLL